MLYVDLVVTREQKRSLMTLCVPTALVMALGVLTISKSFDGGQVFYGVVGLMFLAGAFFAVFEIGRRVGRML